MIGPVDGLSGLISASNQARQTRNALTAFGLRSGQASAGDVVDFSSNQVLDAVRVQAGVLKNELPGLIADALLAPVTDQATRNQPLNSLLFRLVSPLDSVLGRMLQEDIPDSLVMGLREELGQLSNDIPNLVDDAILTQFSEDLAQSDPLNALLINLSTEVDSLIGRLGG